MMSNEEWDRQVEFLLKQQAQFDIDMRRIEATQEETGKFLAQMAENLAEQSYVMFKGFEIAKAEMRELRESQKLTDEQLRKFIAKVDRLTGEAQNGSLN
jgi:hypothetical protein